MVTNTATKSDTAATDAGWHVLTGSGVDGMDRPGAAPVNGLVSAGVWTFNVAFTTSGADLTGAAAVVTVRVYRRGTAGAYTLLFSAVSAGVSVTVLGAKTVTFSSASQPAYTFAVGETLHTEWTVTAQGVAVTGNTYALNLGAGTNFAFPLEAGQTKGIVSNFPRTFSVTGLGTAQFAKLIRKIFTVTSTGTPVFTRLISATRRFTATATGTPAFARQIIFNRRFNITATGTPRLRLNLPEEALDRIQVGGPTDYSPNDGLKAVAGVVKDSQGNPLTGAEVTLVRVSDNFKAATQTSAAGGVYNFPRGSTDPNTYYVVVYTGDNRGGLSSRPVSPS